MHCEGDLHCFKTIEGEIVIGRSKSLEKGSEQLSKIPYFLPQYLNGRHTDILNAMIGQAIANHVTGMESLIQRTVHARRTLKGRHSNMLSQWERLKVVWYTYKGTLKAPARS